MRSVEDSSGGWRLEINGTGVDEEVVGRKKRWKKSMKWKNEVEL